MMASWTDYWDNILPGDDPKQPHQPAPNDPTLPGGPWNPYDPPNLTNEFAFDLVPVGGNNGGGGGGGGGNGGGGNGGGGGGGAGGPLAAILQGFGLRPGQFQELIDKAIRNGWSPAQFESAIYRSKVFRHAFPGIFRHDGSLRMSPAEYMAQRDSYRELAQKYGLTGQLDDKRVGALIEGNVSLSELNDRFSALHRMEEYKPALEAFKEVLAGKGINKKWSDVDMYQFVMGQGPKEFYKIWEEASIGTAAYNAGINLNAKKMQTIAKRIPGIQTEEAVFGSMQELAQKVKTLIPLSQMAKFNITKSDLVELQYGGKNQASIAKRVQELINVVTGEQDDTRKAFDTTAQQGQVRTHGATS